MSQGSLIRAADFDRDAVAAQLRRAVHDGRLTHDEFEERLGAVLSARTYGELDALVADLPAPPAAQRRRPPLPVWAAGTLAGAILLSVLGAVAWTGPLTLYGHRGQAFGGQWQRHVDRLSFVAGPMFALLMMLALCAGLAWLFSQASAPSADV